jgi:hypothetical protein
MHINSNPMVPKSYMSHTILLTILNPKFEKKMDTKLSGFQAMETKSYGYSRI